MNSLSEKGGKNIPAPPVARFFVAILILEREILIVFIIRKINKPTVLRLKEIKIII
jgi:hypothetical protein